MTNRQPIRALFDGRILLAIVLAGCGNGASGAPQDAGDARDAVDAPEGGAVAVYDLGAEFSLLQNPNGPWRYGYTPSDVLDPTAVLLDGFADDSSPIGFWQPSSAEHYPYIAHNGSTSTAADPTNSWALRSGEVSLEGSSIGLYSVIQFAAPRSAKYDIRADFAGVHFRLSSTDVHVLENGASLFDGRIEGYGGDPAFHAVEGSTPTASFQGIRTLASGDTLTFAVGVGGNGNFNDTTGLFVQIKMFIGT